MYVYKPHVYPVPEKPEEGAGTRVKDSCHKEQTEQAVFFHGLYISSCLHVPTVLEFLSQLPSVMDCGVEEK